MAFNPLEGFLGAVLLDADELAFDKWELEMNTGLPKVTNFTSNGAQVLVKGIYKGRISLEGPYDQGNMPFSIGAELEFTLQFTEGISIVVNAFIETITPTVDVEDAQRIRMVCQSSGTFTAAIS